MCIRDSPYAMGFTKNKYVGRTFIAPTQAMREDGVNLKLNPVRSVVEGKRVVLVDDSIVRGTTCRRTIELLRRAGAREIHMRVSAPPFVAPCYYGTDIDSADNLIANHHTCLLYTSPPAPCGCGRRLPRFWHRGDGRRCRVWRPVPF